MKAFPGNDSLAFLVSCSGIIMNKNELKVLRCPPTPPILGGNNPILWGSPPKVEGPGGQCKVEQSKSEHCVYINPY